MPSGRRGKALKTCINFSIFSPQPCLYLQKQGLRVVLNLPHGPATAVRITWALSNRGTQNNGVNKIEVYPLSHIKEVQRLAAQDWYGGYIKPSKNRAPPNTLFRET